MFYHPIRCLVVSIYHLTPMMSAIIKCEGNKRIYSESHWTVECRRQNVFPIDLGAKRQKTLKYHLFTKSFSSSLCNGLPSFTDHSCSPLRYSHKPNNPLPEPLIFHFVSIARFRLNKQSKFIFAFSLYQLLFVFSFFFIHSHTMRSTAQ